MKAHTHGRYTRLHSLLLRISISALALTFIATFLGLSGITLYAVIHGTLTAPLPHHEPALQPEAAQVTPLARWRITAPVIIGIRYNHGWGFDRTLAADIVRNGGIIDEFDPRHSPLGSSRFTVRITRAYAERLLAATGAGDHLTPGYREWRSEPVASVSHQPQVAADIIIKQRLYPNREMARAAGGMAIIAAGSFALSLLIWWSLIVAIKSTGTRDAG